MGNTQWKKQIKEPLIDPSDKEEYKTETCYREYRSVGRRWTVGIPKTVAREQ